MKTIEQYVEYLEAAVTTERVFALAILTREIERMQAIDPSTPEDMIIRQGQARINDFYRDPNNYRIDLEGDAVVNIESMTAIDGIANRAIRVRLRPPFIQPANPNVNIPTMEGATYVASLGNALWYVQDGPVDTHIKVVSEVSGYTVKTHIVDMAPDNVPEGEVDDPVEIKIRKALAVAEMLKRYPPASPIVPA